MPPGIRAPYTTNFKRIVLVAPFTLLFRTRPHACGHSHSQRNEEGQDVPIELCGRRPVRAQKQSGGAAEPRHVDHQQPQRPAERQRPNSEIQAELPPTIPIFYPRACLPYSSLTVRDWLF